MRANPGGGGPGRGDRRLVKIGLLAALLGSAAGAAVLAIAYLGERADQAMASKGSTFDGRPLDGPVRVEFLADGVATPPASPADEAGLADDEEVIGVVVDGRARAYRLAAMEGRFDHIVNDVLGGRPVTVTYCNVDGGCVRAFGGEPGGGPLGVGQGGLLDGRMVLVVDGAAYRQEDGAPLDPGAAGPLPHPRIPAARTTWGAWRAEHPETDVVLALDPAVAPGNSGR